VDGVADCTEIARIHGVGQLVSEHEPADMPFNVRTYHNIWFVTTGKKKSDV
jgi:hypothetical protein